MINHSAISPLFVLARRGGFSGSGAADTAGNARIRQGAGAAGICLTGARRSGAAHGNRFDFATGMGILIGGGDRCSSCRAGFIRLAS